MHHTCTDERTSQRARAPRFIMSHLKGVRYTHTIRKRRISRRGHFVRPYKSIDIYVVAQRVVQIVQQFRAHKM